MTPEIARLPSFHTASATSGHTIDQEMATPMTAFKVQPL